MTSRPRSPSADVSKEPARSVAKPAHPQSPSMPVTAITTFGESVYGGKHVSLGDRTLKAK